MMIGQYLFIFQYCSIILWKIFKYAKIQVKFLFCWGMDRENSEIQR